MSAPPSGTVHVLVHGHRGQHPPLGRAVERVDVERDNIRAALAWSLTAESATPISLRLATALWRFWEVSGRLTEARTWLDGLFAHPDARSEPSVLAPALWVAGRIARFQGDIPAARGYIDEALALARDYGDRATQARSLCELAVLAENQGDARRGQAFAEEAVRVARGLDDPLVLADALNELAHAGHNLRATPAERVAVAGEAIALYRRAGDRLGVAFALGALAAGTADQGDVAGAADLHAEALAIFREMGHRNREAYVLVGLGIRAQQQRDYGRAAALFEESLAISRDLGDRPRIASSALALGSVLHRVGERGRAGALFRESLCLYWEMGRRDATASAVQALAGLAATGGWAERAARLYGAAASARECSGGALEPHFQALVDRSITALRARLGDDRFAVVWDEGRALSLDAAVALALEDVNPRTSGSS